MFRCRGAKFLNDTQLKILKTMSEATSRMDLTMFSHTVNLTPNEAIAMIQQLAIDGFLHKVGTGYGITEKGKKALKATLQVPEDKTFSFYVDVDKPLGFSANSLEEFYRSVKHLCSDALDFHLYRGDFENWLRDVVGDSDLALGVSDLRIEGLRGEELRKGLLKVIDCRYGASESSAIRG
jgi:predicted transcriptional regulator